MYDDFIAEVLNTAVVKQAVVVAGLSIFFEESVDFRRNLRHFQAFARSCCFHYFSLLFYLDVALSCGWVMHLQYHLQLVLNPLTGARNLGRVCRWQVLSRSQISPALAADGGLLPASVVLIEISLKPMDRIDEKTRFG